MNKHLIWVFRELVVLILNKLKGGGNVDTISDYVINHELDSWTSISWRTTLYYVKQWEC